MSLEVDSRSRLQKFSTAVLKAGQIPMHIAVIMDGNRRFSKGQGVSISEGYISGYKKLDELLRWAYELGTKEVTAYAFSIENFKRPELEKQIIFRIFKKVFEEEILCDDEFFENGEKRLFVSVRLVGDWSMIPEDLKETFAEGMIKRRRNSDLILNLAVAYTARNELARGAESLRQAVNSGELELGDISEELLSETLQILPTHPVDLLIRTSNTHRLSDFLLWQSSGAVLHFVKEEWPELSFWDVWKGVFKFQQQYQTVLKVRNDIHRNSNENGSDSSKQKRKELFMKNLRAQLWDYLEAEAGN